LSGQLIDSCKNCYQLESAGAISPRLQESARWLKNPEVRQYIENWSTDKKLKTFFYDIRFDNKCNLACITCNPIASSLWAHELSIEPTKYQLNFNINDCLTAKKIYLAGGEPLIIDQFVELIKLIGDLEQQPELVINTNLTKINHKLLKHLAKIKNLTLVVSVDAFGSVNEYHRWPMRWKKFLTNLVEVKDNLACTMQFNTVVDAVSMINLEQLIQFESIIDQWNLSVLTQPPALQIKNIPDQLKDQIRNSFINIKQSKFYRKDIMFKTRVDHALQQLNQPGDSVLLSNFILELDRRRNINHCDYLEVDLS
jgi:sulfatase maturation enzyme AslB (radical SAM superfamily)